MVTMETILALVVAFGIANIIGIAILYAEIKDMNEARRELNHIRMIEEIAEKVSQEAKELFPCECDKEEEDDRQ